MSRKAGLEARTIKFGLKMRSLARLFKHNNVGVMIPVLFVRKNDTGSKVNAIEAVILWLTNRVKCYINTDLPW
jgi:hypothetical protein